MSWINNILGLRFKIFTKKQSGLYRRFEYAFLYAKINVFMNLKILLYNYKK